MIGNKVLHIVYYINYLWLPEVFLFQDHWFHQEQPRACGFQLLKLPSSLILCNQDEPLSVLRLKFSFHLNPNKMYTFII